MELSYCKMSLLSIAVNEKVYTVKSLFQLIARISNKNKKKREINKFLVLLYAQRFYAFLFKKKKNFI